VCILINENCMVEYAPMDIESTMDIESSKELQKELEELKTEVKNNDIDTKNEKIKENKIRAFRELNLGYNPSKDFQIKEKILAVVENFEDDSLEAILLRNPQIQNLIHDIISNQKIEWEKDYEKYKLKKSKSGIEELNEEWYDEETEELVEDWEDYYMHESTPESFEEYLLSEQWIKVLIDEIHNYLDWDWNLYTNMNFKISKKELQIKLKTARINDMNNNYNDITFSEAFWNNIDRNPLISSINRIVWEHLVSWWDKYGKWIINKLEQLIVNEDIEWSLLSADTESINKDNLQVILRKIIEEYANLIINKDKWSNTQLSTWEDSLDLQLKSYLYIYARIFHPSIFNANWWDFDSYWWELKEIFDAVVSFNWDIEQLRRNKYLDAEKKAEEERLERDKRRRHEAYLENIKKNWRWSKEKYEKNNEKEQNENIWDLDKATWEQIAKTKWLSKDLWNYKVKIDETKISDIELREKSFNSARNVFLEQYSYLRGIITKDQMHDIFDVQNGVIDRNKLNIFNNSPIFQWVEKERINQINNILFIFEKKFNKELEKHINFSSMKQTVTIKEVKDRAIWNVIDYIRDIFWSIIERQQWNLNWFKLNIVSPVEINWDDLIISWNFNGSDIKIRYNLESWEIFTNSFFHKPDEVWEPPITIWYWLEINQKIWEIKPFNDILNGEGISKSQEKEQIWDENEVKSGWTTRFNNFYNNFSKEAEEILNSISNELILNTWGQTEKKRAIVWLLKSFNIMRDSFVTDEVTFTKESNLYKIIDVLYASDSSDLSYFNNTFMPTIMRYSWLKWEMNNLSQDIQSRDSRKIFGKNGEDNKNNETRKYLKDKMQNFKPLQFAWVTYFNWTNNLDFANLIEEYLLNDTKTKLNKKNMSDFIEAIETDTEDKL